MLIYQNTEIETDSEGYLKDTTLWSEGLAEAIAANEGIELSPEHWEVVRFVRNFYLEFNTSPAIRMLVKAMANTFGEEKGNSRYLYRLFPKGPAKQATKIAGLPKPVKCILIADAKIAPRFFGLMRLARTLSTRALRGPRRF
ncbi:Sulfurtransferase TusE [Kluyvera cryocrescens]|uniref:Sulfurtransferase TusE n=2 Tax=Kluyvera cryocrescens TaxID=580 RepID=A0A485CX05_KLUCR|nr:Sulfurtransferase TusE [Kluyvera cryocrescens]